jgi:hypothetical protein
MTEFKKPQVSKFNERCGKVLEFMRQRDYVTKADIAEFLGWTLPKHERQIRDIVANISWYYPVVSTSDTNKGFKLAKDDADAELVKHAWAEIDSRIEELAKRKRPLIKFLDKRNIKITLFD